MQSVLDRARIERAVKKNKRLNKIIFFDTIDSTNSFLYKGDIPGGTIAAADVQEKGRGKHGAVWVSARGGLWFSFVFTKKIKRPYYHVMLSSVAVAKALKIFGVKPRIKWPNDIIVSGRKICGILTENDYYRGRVVTGVGINVNNSPPESRAISLKEAAGKEADITLFFLKILRNIESGFERGKRAEITSLWNEMLVKTGEPVIKKRAKLRQAQ
ncbi:MAG TPA: biotin--[acetyl-CoA-carboxylase] ligase [bacterium]|nr:biotin--[acetyl-CoA-carboxylase] ligase [bacterium]